MYVLEVVHKVEEPVEVTQRNIKRLIEDLTLCLSKYTENYRFIPFGSSISGLATKNSDIDIMVMSGDNKSPVNLKLLSKQLKISWRHRRVIFINCSVPIIKIVHPWSRKNVDISCFNPTSLKNTQIVRSILSIDEKIRHMILFLKEWMANHDLLGCGLFTTFALTSMVAFYLQQMEIPILPSLFLFKQNTRENDNLDEWDCNFDCPVQPKLLTNGDSLCELLFGFFEYYANFEYDRYVISPYYGKVIPIADINDPEALPDVFSAYKNSLLQRDVKIFPINNCVCVQSPFQHNNNITRTVSRKSYINFVKYCKGAVHKIKSDNNSFENIFGIQFESLACKNRTPDEHFVIQYERNAINQALQKEISLEEQYQLVTKTMEYVLRHIFLCEKMEITTDEEKVSESGYKKTTVIITGTSTKDIISNRKIDKDMKKKLKKNSRQKKKITVYWNSQFSKEAKQNEIIDPESLMNIDIVRSCMDKGIQVIASSSDPQPTKKMNDKSSLLGEKQSLSDYKNGCKECSTLECDEKESQTSAETGRHSMMARIRDIRKSEEETEAESKEQSNTEIIKSPTILKKRDIRQIKKNEGKTEFVPKQTISETRKHPMVGRLGELSSSKPSGCLKNTLDLGSNVNKQGEITTSAKSKNSMHSETPTLLYSGFPNNNDEDNLKEDSNARKYSEAPSSVNDVKPNRKDHNTVKKSRGKNSERKRIGKKAFEISIENETVFEREIELSKLIWENSEHQNKRLNITVTITTDNNRILVLIKGNCKASTYFIKGKTKLFPLIM